MSSALPTELQPNVVRHRISRINVRNTRLQDFFGAGLPFPGEDGQMPANAANNINYGGRDFAWDILDSTRKIATARLPGQPSATRPLIPIGTVRGAFPRSAEKVPINHERIDNLRPLGGVGVPGSALSERSIAYVTSQERELKRKVTNLREFQLAAMLRGSYTYTQTNDDLFHDFSGGATTVNFQIPAGNLSKLDMLGAGDILGTSWDNAAAPIPGDLDAITIAFEQLTGMPLENVIINSVGMGHVLVNTAVIAQAGTANTVYEEFRQIEGTNDFFIRLKCRPWIKWHVINEVLDVGTSDTTTKLIADTQATFLPAVTSEWFQYWNGSERITDYVGDGRGPHEEFGGYFWYKPIDDPSGFELKTVHNGFPALFRPKAIATGLIVY